MLDTILQLAGRAHPMLLHLPIGMLTALVCLELLALPEFIKLDARARAALAWLVALSAAASVATGLLLEREPGYGGETLDLHKWLGIGLGVCTLLMAASLCSKLTRKLYPLLLLLGLGAMFPAGHLGATMTHGEGFLTEPLFPRPPEPVRGASSTVVPTTGSGLYAQQIAPIFERYCISCHGESKQKGKLALHTPDAIRAGGETGFTIDPGDPENSEIVFRLRLPLADRDRMPPKDKPQPDDHEITLIEEWIAAGAQFEGGERESTDGSTAAPSPRPDSAPAAGTDASRVGESDKVPTARPELPLEALAALRQRQAHAEVIDPSQNLLWVSFDGVAAIDDATTARLLAPLTAFITDLSLAGTSPGTTTLAQIANMPELRRLSVARADMNAGRFLALADAPHAALEELNLSGVSLDDSAATLLASRFPKLQRVFLWKCGLSDAAIAELRSRRPALSLQFDSPPDTPLETEPPPAFTSDAPPLPTDPPTSPPAPPPPPPLG